jgi:alpha-amylase/alpha-mannosidase (GH57 family)
MPTTLISAGKTFLVVHGHFYQPPRENPWIEEIELEESAYPFPNWNARITRECYTPNTCARIRDEQLRDLDIVNNFRYINFNIGPTLISWLAANAPVTYERILAADRESVARLGFGNAIAQVYNHIIMPLANVRDRETEILWGLRDFAFRFQRQADAMWLPETAVNLEVLRDLVNHGMRYVILSPWQAKRIRPLTGGYWQDVSSGNIDTTKPYRCFVDTDKRDAASKKFIDIFFYDGQTAAGLSFGDLLKESVRMLDNLGTRLSPDRSRPQLLNVATDGETFGHHKPFYEMGLAYALSRLCPERGWQVTNYRAFLEVLQPFQEVEISLGPQGEGTAWSCAHGLGRWQRDCGCNTGGEAGWNQKWRAPLRRAFNFLNEKLAVIFAQAGSRYLKDPWAARNDYIEVILNRSEDSRNAFFRQHASGPLSPADQIQVLKLLEMERHVLLMYTSCGWFFSDLAGLETLQVLKYAARALQLGQQFSTEDLEAPFLAILQEARSNRAEMGSGRDLYLNKIRPAIITFPKLVNQFSISLLNNPQRQQVFSIYHYHPELLDYEEKSQAGLDLALGRVKLTSGITLNNETLGYATLFLGSYLYRTQVKAGQTETEFDNMVAVLFKALEQAPEDIVNTLASFFGSEYYSVRDMFKREKRDILKNSLQNILDETDLELLRSFTEAQPLLFTMTEEGFVIPPVFHLAATTALSRRIMQILYSWAVGDEEHLPKRDLADIISISQKLNIQLKDDPAGKLFASILEQRLVALAHDFCMSKALNVDNLLSLGAELPLEVDIMEAQNLFFHLMEQHFNKPAVTGRQAHPDYQEFSEVLLRLAVKLNFNPVRYTSQLPKI